MACTTARALFCWIRKNLVAHPQLIPLTILRWSLSTDWHFIRDSVIPVEPSTMFPEVIYRLPLPLKLSAGNMF